MAKRWIPHVSSFKDYLLLIVTFSVLSVYFTYHLNDNVFDGTVSSSRRQREKYRYEMSKLNIATQLRERLRTTERSYLEHQLANVALIRGHPTLLQKEATAYSALLQKSGFAVYSSKTYTSTFNRSISDTGISEWNLLLCLAFSDGEVDCLSRKDYPNLKKSKRINRIPGMRNVLWRRSALCRTINHLSSLESIASFEITPRCFVLPENYEDLLNFADGAGFNYTWFIKSAVPGGKLERVTTMEYFNLVRSKRISTARESIVQMFMENQLRVFGMPISVQYFVIITSIAPLRFYIYKEGIVHFRREEDRNYKKIPGKWWLVSQLWNHVTAVHGGSYAKLARENTENMLVHLLLGSEAFLLVQISSTPSWKMLKSHYRCEHCFHLMTVEILYNSSFHPFVIEINGNPSMTSDPADVTHIQDKMRQDILRDALKMVFSSDSVHADIYEVLHSLLQNYNIGVVGMGCTISHDICLSQEDLNAFFASRRESINVGNFKRLYPSTSGANFDAFVQELQGFMLNDPHNIFQEVNMVMRESKWHGTLDLHNIFTAVEKYFDAEESTDEDYMYIHDNRRSHLGFSLQSVSQERRYKYSTSIKPDGMLHSPCSLDPDRELQLKEIFLEPEVVLIPAFSPLWTEYHAVVPYDITAISITATTFHCHTQVRFENEAGPLGSIKTTLGIGLNRVSLLLRNATSGVVLQTYLVALERLPMASSDATLLTHHVHSVCSLTQECDLMISSSNPCGLIQEKQFEEKLWPDILQNLITLPPCSSGDASGIFCLITASTIDSEVYHCKRRWLIPCGSCSVRSSCVWSEARWQPYTCSHPSIDRKKLSECLTGKKLLFLGDSTNRGMMHYVMEKLNGSLARYDKTHNIRLYSRLNNGQTTIGFAYYPQFWIPLPQRPVFDKTLYQLLLKSQPLKNNSDTVLIVGGVHWLATQHLHSLLRIFKREGLQGARLVIKTLGSGFHIPAEGVHHVSKEKQKRLLKHSMGLCDFARYFNLEVVDTFNMTAARYNDFYQGKCACHFHKLEEVHAPRRGYRVEGPINAAYTDILLSRLC